MHIHLYYLQVDNDTVTKQSFRLLFRGTELIVAGKLKDLEKSDFNSTLNADSIEGDFIEPTIVTCFDHPILPPVVATEKKPIGN